MKYTYVEEIFDYNGYTCACVFLKNGYRCGYVAIDETHPWYKKDYNDEGPNEVLCHWGLTYSGRGSHFCDEGNLWWFGFDCGHSCDIVDFDTTKQYGLVNDKEFIIGKQMYEMISFDGATLKDIDFVKDNCKMIVEQLIIAEKRG